MGIDRTEAGVGSPPRVRGTVIFAICFACLIGITPACAGNRNSFLRIPSNNKDHPRVCGEQHMTQEFFTWTMGSPPRVRGTAPPANCPSPGGRITPACAGNRSTPFPLGWNRRDHPRVCGEQRDNAGFFQLRKGSPPRVRGTGARRSLSAVSTGITPACAGNSHPGLRPGGHRQDHPRVCGEQ